MKKVLVPILLVLLLSFVFTSCDATIRSNIADLMGGFSGNVYLENGLIEANTADAEAAVATVTTLGSTATSTAVASDGTTATTSSLGISVDVSTTTDITVLTPQTSEEQTALQDDLASTFASPTQTEALIEELSTAATTEQVTAAQGTVEVFNATLTALQSEVTDPDLQAALGELALPTIDSTDELTQADILVLQMMTNLISNTVNSLSDGAGGYDTANLDQDEINSIVDDALFAAQVAEQLSGAASIDFTGSLDLTSLLSSAGGLGISKAVFALGDGADAAAMFKDLIPVLIDLMGITKDSSGNYVYTASAYKSFVINQKAYRNSIRQMLTFARQSTSTFAELFGTEVDTSTLMKYVLSVAVTENDAYMKNEGVTAATLVGEIVGFLNANKALLAQDTFSSTDELTVPDSIQPYYDNVLIFLHDGTTEKPRTVDYYVGIINNLKDLNSVNGITQLDDALDSLLDTTKTENIYTAYDSWPTAL